jgi:hypothetical protein
MLVKNKCLKYTKKFFTKNFTLRSLPNAIILNASSRKLHQFNQITKKQTYTEINESTDM